LCAGREARDGAGWNNRRGGEGVRVVGAPFDVEGVREAPSEVEGAGGEVCPVRRCA
jgi:hypothetical protein